MMYYYGDWFFPFQIIGGIFMAIFWIVIILLIIRVVRGGSGWHRWHNVDRSLEILKERYVKGEITKEQFEEMKKTIKE